MTAAITRTNRPATFSPTIVWLVLASLVGWLVGSQPLAVVVIGLAIVGFIVISTITPIAALVVMLVLAPMRTLIATEASVQLPLDIGQIALIIFPFSWSAYRTARGQKLFYFTWSPVLTPVMLFVAIISLTAFNTASLGKWFTEWLKWIEILILVVLTLDIASPQNWHWLLMGLVLAGVANAVVGIYEFFGGSGAIHLLINGRFFRAFGTFGQPNPFGGFMGLLLPITLMAGLACVLKGWSHWHHREPIPPTTILLIVFYVLASLLLLAGLVFSWSRGAWLGFGAALLVIAIALPRRTWLGLALFGLLLMGVVLLWVSDSLPRSVTERLQSSTAEFFAFEDVRGVDITPENYAVVERLAHWQAALNMATYSPWVGIGAGNYKVVYSNFQLINWSESLGHAHNYYLNILAEAGIIGLLGYGKVWLVIMWLTWRARSHPDIFARFVVVGLLGTWTYLAVHSLFDNLYVNNLFLHIGLMLGLLAILYNQTWKSKRLKNP